jgi:DNA-binding transcriptional LysR family regulator
VNIQHLKHFTAVAEELHFGRAAERIGMAQPPLSQSIRRLEGLLDAKLFNRTRHRVELTAAGAALLEHAREILSQLEYAQKAVARAKENGLVSLAIGFTPNALSEAVPAAVKEIRRLAPDVRIRLHEAATEQQVAGLLTGEYDLGFFHPPSTDIRGIDARVVESTQMLLAAPANSDLATRETVRMADLAGQPLMMFPPSQRPDVHAALMSAFRAVGVAPQIEQEAAYSYTRLKLVAAGMGISLVSRTTAPDGYPGVVMRPIEDMPAHIRIDLVLACRRTAAPSVRRVFLAAFEAIRRT